MKKHTNTKPFRHSHGCPIGRGEARVSAIQRAIPKPNVLTIGVIVSRDSDTVLVEYLASSGDGEAVDVVFADGAQLQAVRTGDLMSPVPRALMGANDELGTVLFMERDPIREQCCTLATAQMVA